MLRKYQKSLFPYPCNFCGRNSFTLVAKEKRFKTHIPVVICNHCGLICLNPRWPKDVYADFYKEDYRKLIPVDADSQKIYENQLSYGKRILEFCEGHLSDGLKVFEIGCAAGGVLQVFKDARKAEVQGLEPNIAHADFASEKLNTTIQKQLVEDYLIKESEYDFILMTQTVNHLFDPMGVFKKVYAMLKGGGKFYIDVQNFSEYLKFSNKPFQVDHIYYFYPEVLLAMLKFCGFSPVKVSVDTCKDFREVLRREHHRGAFIHAHILAEKVCHVTEGHYPDAKKILQDVRSILFKKKCLLPFTLPVKLLRKLLP